MSFSNYLENVIMDHARGGTAWAQPAGIYVKFHLGDPGEDCLLLPAAETTRVIVPFGSASVNGVISNTAIVALNNVSTAETYAYLSLWDALTAGNPYGSGALTTARTVTVGENVQFAIGALTFSVG